MFSIIKFTLFTFFLEVTSSNFLNQNSIQTERDSSKFIKSFLAHTIFSRAIVLVHNLKLNYFIVHGKKKFKILEVKLNCTYIICHPHVSYEII